MYLPKVSRGLQRSIPQSDEGFISFWISSLLHKPSRRFGTEPYPKQECSCWYESGSNFCYRVSQLWHSSMFPEVDLRRRQARPSPAEATARLAEHPKNIPKAVHVCHDMTKPPRIFSGALSAENMGTVTSFNPIPTPSSIRHMRSSCQVLQYAAPSGASRPKIAPMNIVLRLPNQSLSGCASQPAL